MNSTIIFLMWLRDFSVAISLTMVFTMCIGLFMFFFPPIRDKFRDYLTIALVILVSISIILPSPSTIDEWIMSEYDELQEAELKVAE